MGRIECGWILYNPIAWSFSLRIIAFTSIHYSIIHGIFLAHFIIRPHKFRANDEKELSFVLNPLIVYRFECMQLVPPTNYQGLPSLQPWSYRYRLDFIERHTPHHIGFGAHSMLKTSSRKMYLKVYIHTYMYTAMLQLYNINIVLLI